MNFANLFKKQNLKPLNEMDNEAIIDFFTVYNIKDVFYFFFKQFINLLNLNILINRIILLMIGIISKFFLCFMYGYMKFYGIKIHIAMKYLKNFHLKQKKSLFPIV